MRRPFPERIDRLRYELADASSLGASTQSADVGALTDDEVLDRLEQLLGRAHGLDVPYLRPLHADTSPQVGMGDGSATDSSIPLPLLSQPARREAHEGAPSPWVAAVVLTDDGVPIEGVQFEVSTRYGFSARAKTDRSGRVRLDVRNEEPHALRMLLDVVFPAMPDAPRPTDGLVLGRFEDDTIEISANKEHTLVVARPRATIVSIDGWAEARAVMLFGTMREDPEGPVTVRGALRQALSQAGAGDVHVVGHTDTEGKAADNESLALERARSVHLYLAGDREGWAAHAFANADVATLQAALKWAATASEIACDPGEIDGDWGPGTANALAALRDDAAIDQTQPLGPDDWAAIFDLYDQDLARILLTDVGGVVAAKARLRLIAPETKGERFPVDAPELDDHECPANRRVDIVLCAVTSISAPDSDDIYDGTFVREHLAVGAESLVRLKLRWSAIESAGSASADVVVSRIGRRSVRADANGLATLLVLRGDRICIRDARSAMGDGHLTGALGAESNEVA